MVGHVSCDDTWRHQVRHLESAILDFILTWIFGKQIQSDNEMQKVVVQFCCRKLKKKYSVKTKMKFGSALSKEEVTMTTKSDAEKQLTH